MRALFLAFVLATAVVSAQEAGFDVASVKVSGRVAGPDSNNQVTVSAGGITARNVTLRKLIALAYGVQMNQVLGPGWLDTDEFEVQARAEAAGQVAGMLRVLLAERFRLRVHEETRNMRAYTLTVEADGPRFPAAGRGWTFHGDMRQFADVVAVQLTVPAPVDPTRPAMAGGSPAIVLDKTRIPGVREFGLDVKPELGADGFPVWRRVLREQMGLALGNGRVNVPVIVVDDALRVPTAN